LLVRTVLGLIGVLVISSALLYWRLSYGPIQLDMLTPSIQKAVAGLPGGFEVQLDGIELFWDRQDNEFQFRATNVALADHNGVSIATAPAVSISISVAALMSRVVALSTIELSGVSVHLIRNEDGSLQLGKKVTHASSTEVKPDETGDFRDLTEFTTHIFTMLELQPDLQYPLSYLKTIKLEGDLTAEDRKLAIDWRSSDIDFTFRKQKNGVAGNLSLSIDDPAVLAGLGLKISLLARGKSVTLDVETGIKHLKIDDLGTIWPAGLVPGTRSWLTENIKLGTVDDVNMSLKMTLPIDDVSALSLTKLEGKVAYSDLSVFFLRPMPPATGVTGSGTFDQHGFDLVVDSGTVNGVAIKSGKVLITGLDVKDAALDVKTHLAGPVADALAIVSLPPLNLDKVIGFGSADTGGQMTAEFDIALPLKSGLGPEEIDYLLDATLTHASVQKILGDYSMEKGSIQIHDSFNRKHITGSMELAGVPITLEVEGVRDGNGVLKTKIKARAAQITASDFSRLGYPVDDYLAGSFSAELDAIPGPGRVIDASIITDLTESGLAIPVFRWSKPAGVEGKAAASIRIEENGMVKIADIKIDAGTLSASGEADFHPGTPEFTIDLDSAGFANTLLNDVSVSRDQDHGTQIRVAGGHLDLAPFIAHDASQTDSRSDAIGSEVSALLNDDDSASGGLKINVVKLDKVFFRQDRYLENVSIELKADGAGWQSIHASGHNPFTTEYHSAAHSKNSATRLASGEFEFRYGPSDKKNYQLSIEVENLGSWLSTTLDNNEIAGGYLTVKGTSTAALLQAPITASLSMGQFAVINAPLLAQVFSIASLRHLLNAMNTKGLPMDVISGDLTLSDKVLSTQLMAAHGGSLGFIIEGSHDFTQGILDLKGRVIPLYRISHALSKIPVLDQIVVGDDGKGIIALDFAIKGSTSKPAVSVNEGEHLALGELHILFGLAEPELKKLD
jgi:hypothetical protein